MTNERNDAIVICPASDFCTNVGCEGSVLAFPIGQKCVKLIVECESVYSSRHASGLIEGYDAKSLAEDYHSGDDVAKWLILIDAPVCCSNGPEEISNPNIFINGSPSN